MSTIDIRKFQLSQMDLIKETDKVCKKLGINYYLIGGTLLGAIRHGGFIPWDTDMDIAMKRSDYEKFAQYWMNNESDKFFYQSYKTEKNHVSPHAILKIKNTYIKYNKNTNRYKTKYNGLFLDIFPLDQPPKDEKKQKKQMKQIKIIKRIIELKAAYTYGENTGKLKYLAKNTVSILLSPLTLNFLQKRLDAIMQKYNGTNENFLVSMASHYSYQKQLMPSCIYGEPTMVEYEGVALCAPAKVEEYLKRIFGDYMKLPPENKRYTEINDIIKVDYGGDV